MLRPIILLSLIAGAYECPQPFRLREDIGGGELVRIKHLLGELGGLVRPASMNSPSQRPLQLRLSR